MGFQEERERARGLATRIVAVAIGIVGLILMAFAVALTWQGGFGFLLLTVLLFVVGFVVAAIGFFFQLVPLRLDELASLKREHDARTRER